MSEIAHATGEPPLRRHAGVARRGFDLHDSLEQRSLLVPPTPYTLDEFGKGVESFWAHRAKTPPTRRW